MGVFTNLFQLVHVTRQRVETPRVKTYKTGSAGESSGLLPREISLELVGRVVGMSSHPRKTGLDEILLAFILYYEGVYYEGVS